MKLSNKTYDFLKFLAQIVLPALATLMVTLGNIYNWDFTEETVATIVAVDTFLGVLLGIASNSYNTSGPGGVLDGSLKVTDSPDKAVFQLSLDTPPETLAKQDRVVLKVQNVVTPPDENPVGRLLG